MKTFGERLKHIRGKSSQAEFAALFGIPQVTLGNYERNRNEPRFELVQNICLHFEINVEWLLFGTGPMCIGDSPETPDQPQHAPPAGAPCERCAKLETELEEERRERRELTAENRQLWKENGDLREKCARLEGQGAQDACLPFKKLPNTQSSDRANS